MATNALRQPASPARTRKPVRGAHHHRARIYLSRFNPMLSGEQVGSISAITNPVTWMTAPLFIDDEITSNSGAVQHDDGGFPNADPQQNQQQINAIAKTAIAALSPQSGGLFINLSATSKAQLP